MALRIAEIFGPTIQGEGSLIGEPTVFVRAGGCDYRCSWCDSLHAVESEFRKEWLPMSSEEVWAEAKRLSGDVPLVISLSGGNPAIQDFSGLIALGKVEGYRFACETQGPVARDWFADLDTLVLSPKPPSSGETVDWDVFKKCVSSAGDGPNVIIKIVIFDDIDYAWAKEAANRFPDIPLYLQPGNSQVDPNTAVALEDVTDRLLWLVEKAIEDKWYRPRMLPQLHVLLWGNKRGV